MGELETIKTALRNATQQLNKVDDNSCALEAEVLLAHALQKDRPYLRAWAEKFLTEAQLRNFLNSLNERLQGKPIAYIVGEREFWSRSFHVTPDVLIPRPETELLIDIALQKLTPEQDQILDLGTGSGIIAITLMLELPSAHITASDLSLQALKIAKENAQQLGATNTEFLHSNWFENIPAARFDLILSNPPYIDENDHHLNQGDVRFEPKSALVSPQNGLEDIQIIATQARAYLKDQSYLLLEHGYQQSKAVKILLASLGYAHIEQFNDLQGHTRATLAQFNLI